MAEMESAVTSAGIPDLQKTIVSNPEIDRLLLQLQTQQALTAASSNLSQSMCDLAVVYSQTGNVQKSISLLQEALNLQPASQVAFHNLVSILLKNRLLREGNLCSILQHLGTQVRQSPWAGQYRHLAFLPTFLNIELVAGKCNLRCRMCCGTNSPGHPNELKSLSVESFEAMLQSAPTAANITLSAGDSDPLLHPRIDSILELAVKYGVKLDFFTNGHALDTRLCRLIIQSQAVSMINFSLDAASAHTYRAIRRGDFQRVIGRIEMLAKMKADLQASLPRIGLSMVAMADNIQELPDFVDLARKLGAGRVYVEDLNGWGDAPSGNLPASRNPQCREFIRRAIEKAANDIILTLADGLRPPTIIQPPASQPATAPAVSQKLSCCGWLQAAWVNIDGSMNPCCMVGHIVDMGNIFHKPLLENTSYNQVKKALLSGRIFPQCLSQPNCQYVQQQITAGMALKTITPDQLELTAR